MDKDPNLEFIINHVFLPPKLLQEDDTDVSKNASLIEHLQAALRLFQAHSPEQERSEWLPCIKMTRNMLELRNHSGGLVAENVKTLLREMTDGGTNEKILRYVISV